MLFLGAIPTGIQRIAGQVSGQHSDLGAAGLLRVPAQEVMAGIDRSVSRCYTIIGVVALDTIIHAAAVGIIINKTVVAGFGVGIHTIEVHIGLAQAAANQAGQDLATGAAPQREDTDHLAAGGAILHSIMQHTVCIVDPGTAAVICKGDQCIKLTLSKGQTILINQFGIDHAFGTCQIVTQQDLCIFFGNAVCLIFFQHIIGATGTVTHSILTIIPVGFGRKTFLVFQDLHKRITGSHLRGRMDSGSCSQRQTCKQHNCQQQTGNTFHHR